MGKWEMGEKRANEWEGENGERNLMREREREN